MIVMTRQLNRASFRGRNTVTCYTCHRGSAIPAGVPEIELRFVNTTRRDADEPEPRGLPTVGDLLRRFDAATHLTALRSARITLEASHAKIVDAGTPRARVIPRAAPNTGEVLVNGDKAVARSPLPGGTFMLVGSNGVRAWTSGPNGLQWIPDSEFAQFQRKLNPLLSVRLRLSDFVSGAVAGEEIMHGQPAYVVEATSTSGELQKLWFSKTDGLLLRRTFYHAIAMGLDPEQYDFSEYRDCDGIELPLRINTSYLDDQHLGVMKRLIHVEVGVPFSDADFMPRGARPLGPR